jgi:hypothetical protein
MRTTERFDQILLHSSSTEEISHLEHCEKLEVDTSCAHVPIGFVALARSVDANARPDEFWSSCIATDKFIDPVAAKIEALSSASVEEIFQCIRQDLARVIKAETVSFPSKIEECFALLDGCASCCGQVLLIKTNQEVIYVHWHRES